MYSYPSQLLHLHNNITTTNPRTKNVCVFRGIYWKAIEKVLFNFGMVFSSVQALLFPIAMQNEEINALVL